MKLPEAAFLDFAIKVIAIVVAVYVISGFFSQPEPVTIIETEIEYLPGKPDTVVVRDTVYVDATFPVTAEEVDGRVVLSLDTLHIHDESISVRVWSRDIAVEGVKISVTSIVTQVEITAVDTLREVVTRTIEKQIPWYKSQTMGIVIGATGTLAVLWATRRLE
jgi:hypothetical protein